MRGASVVLVGLMMIASLVADVTAQPAKGEPVNIGVGYFPSWNGGWSGVVIKKKELWKKYLPAGSTVRWDVVLVGFPVFNGLLANKLQIGYLGDAPGREVRGEALPRPGGHQDAAPGRQDRRGPAVRAERLADRRPGYCQGRLHRGHLELARGLGPDDAERFHRQELRGGQGLGESRSGGAPLHHRESSRGRPDGGRGAARLDAAHGADGLERQVPSPRGRRRRERDPRSSLRRQDAEVLQGRLRVLA